MQKKLENCPGENSWWASPCNSLNSSGSALYLNPSYITLPCLNHENNFVRPTSLPSFAGKLLGRQCSPEVRHIRSGHSPLHQSSTGMDSNGKACISLLSRKSPYEPRAKHIKKLCFLCSINYSYQEEREKLVRAVQLYQTEPQRSHKLPV